MVRIRHFRIFSGTHEVICLLLESKEVLLLLLFKLLLVQNLSLDSHLHLELLLCEGLLQLCLSPLILNSVHIRDIALKLVTEMLELWLVDVQPKFNHF